MYPIEQHKPLQPISPPGSVAPSVGTRRGPRRAAAQAFAALSLAAALFMVFAGCSPTESYASSLIAASPTSAATQTASAVTTTVNQQSTPSAVPSATRTLSASATPTAAKRPTATTPPTIKRLPQTPTITEYAQTATVFGLLNGTVSATCPLGAYALGGGWAFAGQSARVFGAAVSGNSWVVRVHPMVGRFLGVAVTAYVECLSGVSSATVTQNTINSSVAPTARDAQYVFCGSGVPVGYGFDLSAAPASLELQATNPETFEEAVWWNFWVRNNDTVTHQISTTVVCLSNVTESNYPLAGSRTVGVYPSYPGQQGGYIYSGVTGTVSVSCPTGTRVAGGGLDYGDSVNLIPLASGTSRCCIRLAADGRDRSMASPASGCTR